MTKRVTRKRRNVEWTLAWEEVRRRSVWTSLARCNCKRETAPGKDEKGAREGVKEDSAAEDEGEQEVNEEDEEEEVDDDDDSEG